MHIPYWPDPGLGIGIARLGGVAEWVLVSVAPGYSLWRVEIEPRSTPVVREEGSLPPLGELSRLGSFRPL